jgi:predicted MPP superfamily phosphohydrolase
MNLSNFDIIGDIHGYADELLKLLASMGYEHKDGYFQHVSRKVIFVGDYIDRGPEIRDVLSIVKSMTDNGQAIALMGNHEYNCLYYHTKKDDGEYLRKHTAKNYLFQKV